MHTRRAMLSFVMPAVVLQARRKVQVKTSLRVLTGGIRHESNTFCPLATREEDFTVLRGEAALRNAEWASALGEAGVEIIPTLHASASPFGVVSRRAFERFQDEILDAARRAGPLDGVYLDMHGALHAEGYEDAQAQFARSLRRIVGSDVVISASFDLHGNLSPEFVGQLNIGTAQRTAPHVDTAQTRLRAVRLLLRALRDRRRPVTVLVQVPILIPGEKGITAVEPLKSLYGELPSASQKPGLLDASIFVGMPWTDVPRASMSVIVVADGQANRPRAAEEAKRLATAVWARRRDLKFDVPTASLDEAIKAAVRAPEKTVFITDSGDNTTAGAAGDSTLVLARLLAHRVRDAVVAGIVDAEAVEACLRAGVDSKLRLALGGKIDTVFGKPLTIRGTVRSLRSGKPPARGPSAVVDVEGILVVLLSERRSFTAPQDFEEVAIDPLAHKIVVVKLGYLFQALRDIAPRTIMALTPGFAYQLVEKLSYRRIRRPMFPLDPDMSWAP